MTRAALSTKGIILDLDNTIYEYEPCHLHAIRRLEEKITDSSIDLVFDSASYDRARARVKNEFGGGHEAVSRDLYMQELVREEKQFADPKLAEILSAWYWNFFFEKMTLKPGVYNLLEHCSSSAIPVGVLTDQVTEVQKRKLNFLGITEFITTMITSEELGFTKPDLRGFERVAQELNAPIRDTAVIGDDWVKDIEPAIGLGCYAFYVGEDKIQSGQNYQRLTQTTDFNVILRSLTKKRS